ncbi:MAG: hypothetical protein LC772_07695 [Chloroflexi bacterium]|nr:hypothetical protein [Chloroflexota bacterium]
MESHDHRELHPRRALRPRGRYLMRAATRGRYLMPAATLSGISILVVSLCAFFVWRDSTPELVIPAPVMPSHNAFDYLVRAGQLAHEGSLSPNGKSLDRLSLAENTQVLFDDRESLALMHYGLTLPYMNPPLRSYSDPTLYYGTFRKLAGVLLMKAQVDGARGDYAAASQADLDSIQMGEKIPRGAVGMGKLVGMACEAIGRHDLWLEVPHLNVNEARQACRRIETIQSGHVPWTDVLEVEKPSNEAALVEEMQKPGWRNGTEYLDFGNTLAYMDACIAQSRLPYVVARPRPPVPDDPVNEIVALDWSEWQFRDALDTTQNSLLEVTLALRAYHLEHNAYPSSLQNLCPHYISSVPADPFGGARGLRYRRIGAGCVLYSVGPDQKDNGGTPATTPNAAPGDEHRVRPNSAGDIVAGVHTR